MFAYKKTSLIFIIISLLFFINTAALYPVYGLDTNESKESKKVVLIVINRVDFRDLYTMPRVRRMIDQGAIGLMNTRGSGRDNEFKAFASLGWGVRAIASAETTAFFNLDEETLPVYNRRTGLTGYSKGIANLNINNLIQQNLRGDFGAVPGTLGEILRQNGLKTAVMGNADTDDMLFRTAAVIAMDHNGYIDYGDVSSNLNTSDPDRPFGIKTDYNKMFETFIQLYSKSDFLVIETGDITRLERYSRFLNPDAFQDLKRTALKDIDLFIEKITDEMDLSSTKLILAVPYPSRQGIISGERLTPVIFYGGGQEEGFLWSGTTRRRAIIGNIDIAPTVLAYFGLESDKMIGKELTVVPHNQAYDEVIKLNNRIVNTSNQRNRVLYSFAIFEIVASVIGLLAIIYRKIIPLKFQKFAAFMLLGSLAAPFSLLIMPLFGSVNIITTYFLFIGITVLTVLIVYLFSKDKPLNTVLYSCSLISAALLLDIITGQNLMKNSLLGYDPIIGARYYGLGNEYMGVLTGAAIILVTTFVERYNAKPHFIVLFFVITAGIIGFPRLGANVGGTIAAVFAFLYTALRLFNQKINFKKIIIILMAVTGVVFIMAIIDLHVLDSKSHLGTAIKHIEARGPIVIYEIISRKLEMNFRILGTTIWSKVLLCGLLISAVLFFRPVGIMKNITSKYKTLSIGWGGVFVACIISFLVNDSGVVAAATTIIFFTTTLQYLIIQSLLKKEDQHWK